MMPAVARPEAAAEDTTRELQLITARVRLLLFRRIAWQEARSSASTPAWQDPWRDRDDLAAWAEADVRGRELAGSLGGVEAAIARGLPRLGRVEDTFSLSRRESGMLQVCLATAVDPELAGVWMAASGRAIPTEPAVATLLGELGKRILTPEAPLSRWDLVHRVELGAGEPAGLAIDPALHDWFTDNYAIDGALVGVVRAVAPVTPLERWPVAQLVAQLDDRWQRKDLEHHVRISIVGPAGSGRRSCAAAVARALGLELLAIDADAVDDASWPRVVRAAHRHGFLTRTALAFTGESLARRAIDVPGGFPLVFACVEPGTPVAAAANAAEFAIDLAPSTTADRAALWRRLIPAAAAWAPPAIADLARHHHTTPADVSFAAQRGATTAAEAAAAVRERARDRLGSLAQRLECPFEWDDLILPPAATEILRDYDYEARERARVWEDPAVRRMFPQGRGLFALFTGTPGTGKTMAAQVIAKNLGVDLFRVSLSAVVSKYVGETAKNLERILARAAHMDAMLLFDEADALFGKRTEIRDAHDRYANTDTNHLLQAIESYAGVAILASNKKANIDSAFIRRLRYVVEFPHPDVAERLELWRRAIAPLCGAEALARLAGVLPAFAAAVQVSGAQIKLAVLAAVFAARRDGLPVAARHLVRGLERELVKDGRSLSERDRESLVSDVR